MIAAPLEIERYRAQFDRLEGQAAGPNWLKAIRRAGIDRFVDVGFPTTRHEEWRFTPIAPIVETEFQTARYEPSGLDAEWIARRTFEDSGGARLVFVNGWYSRELSNTQDLDRGLVIDSLAAVLDREPALSEPHLAHYAKIDQNPFVALNSAFFGDGGFIRIPRGTIVESPIHLVYISTAGIEPGMSHPRTLIVAEENSQATIVESYAGDRGVYLTNAVTEITLAENAVVDHYKVNRESRDAYHIATIQVNQSRSSTFSNHAVTLGGLIDRNDINVYLGGEGGEAILNGLFLGTGKQLIDTHSRIDHAMPHCPSHELYKGILDDQAHGVFNGKIYVHQDAQKTDAKQTNQNLLLSRDATIDTKPQLEIYADDVRCTHGCTIGQLQGDAIFYLRTRGIGLEESRALLTYAFASDILSRIKVAPLRERLEEALFEIEAPMLEKAGIRPD